MRNEREPYKCICGSNPEVIPLDFQKDEPSEWYVACNRNGETCWSGPVRTRRRVAVLAWDRLMMTFTKQRPSTKRRDFEKGAK